MIWFIYAVLIFLVIRFSVTVFNFLSNPKLGYYGRRFPDKVLIIIRASEDDPETEEVLASISSQEHTNVEIMFAQSDADLASLKYTDARYIFFLESRTVISRSLINNALYRMKLFGLGMLVLVPTRILQTLADNLLYPVGDFMLLNLFPLRLSRLTNRPLFAVPVKGVLCYDRDVFLQRFGDDGLEPEQQYIKTEILLANRQAYADGGDMLKTQASELARLLNGHLLIILLYLVLIIGGPLTMFFYVEPGFWIFPISLIFLSRVMTSFLTQQNALTNLLIHPLQMLVLTVLLLGHCVDRLRFVFKPGK